MLDRDGMNVKRRIIAGVNVPAPSFYHACPYCEKQVAPGEMFDHYCEES